MNMSIQLKGLSFFLLVILINGSAYAHATVFPKQAVQGSYQKLSFGISHGCEGSTTVEVIIDLPESIMGAKPMPKAGWTVDAEIRELEKPYMSHGKVISKDVKVIRWKGSLLDSHYDEFVVMTKLWEKSGLVALPVTQICKEGRLDWNQLPDVTGKRLEYPAPILDVVPATHKH